MGEAWSAPTLGKWRTWAAGGLADLKREDARACLQAAAAFVASGARPPSREGVSRPPPSSYVRRRRLVEGLCETEAGLVSSEDVLEELRAGPGAQVLAREACGGRCSRGGPGAWA
ncbi:hypothetical protein ACN28S_07080 [Cystobacter fuscus]